MLKKRIKQTFRETGYFLVLLFILMACQKDKNAHPQQPVPESFYFSSLKVDNKFQGFTYYNVSRTPLIRMEFSAPLDHGSAAKVIQLSGTPYSASFENHDSTIIIQPTTP